MSEVIHIHRPAFVFRIAGDVAPESFLDSLSSWSVMQCLSKPSVCAVQLYDPLDSSLGDLRLGVEIQLEDEDNGVLFSGNVTTIRRQKRADRMHAVEVYAHDALTQLRRRQVIATRQPNSLVGVVSSVVSDLGLSVDADEEGPQLPLMIQWGANDLDWITNVCATYGRYLWLDGQSLKLMSLHGSRGPTLELNTDENLFEVCIESNAVNLRTEATATAWNPLNTESYSASAMDFALEAATAWQGVPAELTQIARDIVGGSGPQDEGVVSHVAQGDLERSVGRAHCLTGLAEGDARLSPGTHVSVTGSDEGSHADFMLTRVEHSYSRDSGYTTALWSEPPSDPQRLATPLVSLGAVIDTDDPDEAGRVKVQLKAFNDIESDWMNVCGLGAGRSKGLIAQPEVGDKVLVAFVNDNPAQGVVLGGLFGDILPHDEDVSGNRPRPYSFRTEGGQLIRLDDQHHSIRLESQGGTLDLHPERVVLEANTDLRIAAPGSHITIVADKIYFEKG